MAATPGWMYYKKAAIPVCAPHEAPKTTPPGDKTIWNINGKKPLFARWTTDFDCGYDTGWYYIIKNAPFDPEELSSKSRKHIRQAQKKVYVKKVDPRQYAEQLFAVHRAACATYRNYKIHTGLSDFLNCTDDKIDYWAAFSVEENILVGYIQCKRSESYVETLVAKYAPEHLALRPSDALHFAILDYYLNTCAYKYVCSGSRNISHDTNAQEYKIKTFGFKKAYCKLHLYYKPTMRIIVNILFAFRTPLYRLDRIGFFHKVNAILRMEEIARKQRTATTYDEE